MFFHVGAGGRECRKLHATALAVLAAASPVRADDSAIRREVPRYLGRAERAALHGVLSGQVVEVRRHVPPIAGATAPAPDVWRLAGVCLAPGRVLTAHRAIEGWPMRGRAGPDTLAVVLPGRPDALPAAVGHADPMLGIAVLDVADWPGGTCLPASAIGPGDADLLPGSTLYAVVAGDPHLKQVGVRGPGKPPRQWYLEGEGDLLPVGTPLFSSHGTWMTIVGLVDELQPQRASLVPAPAIRLLLEERFRWDP